MALVQRDLGPRSPWGRFRLAVERFDSLLLRPARAPARRPRATTRCSPFSSSSATRTATRRATATCATSSWRCSWRGHDTSAASLSWAFERLARHPAVQDRLREGDPAYLDAVVKEVAPRAAGAHDRAAPAGRAGRRSPAGSCPPACRWPPACGCRCVARTCGRTPAPSGPSAGWTAARPARPRGSRSAAACAAAPARPFAEMEMREVLRAAAELLELSPGPPEPESRAPAARSWSRRTAAARCSPGGARSRSPARAARTGGAASACCRRGRRRTPCGRRRCRRCRP